MSTIDASCPECGAEYKLTSEQLAVAQGQVRCGACMNIFQAVPSVAAAIAEPETEEVFGDEEEVFDDASDDVVIIQDDASNVESLSDSMSNSLINRSGEGNFFEDDASVDVIAEEEPVDESWVQDLMDEAEELPEPPVSKAQDASNIDDFAAEIQLKQSDYNNLGFDENDKAGLLSRITPEPLELKVVRDHSSAINLFFSLLLVTLVIITAFQVLYFQADTLGRKPEWRKTYTEFCKLAKCELPEQYSIKDISAGSTHQKQHSVYQGALIVETVITNHAKFRQPFPNIDIYFKNMKDEVIAARSFMPSEYLRGAIATSKTMPVRQPIHLALEVNDPGVNATGYEVKLSYPK